MAQSASGDKPVRLEILISAKEWEEVRREAEAEGVSPGVIFRRAWGVYKFLEDNLGSGEQELKLVDEENGEVVTLRIGT